MSLRNLVEGQCGQNNPLMKLTDHVTLDKSHRQDIRHNRGATHQDFHENIRGYHSYPELSGADQLVNEFTSDLETILTTAPQTFKMDSLLQEMQDIERLYQPPPTIGPAVADLASKPENWAEEYLASNGLHLIEDQSENWSTELAEEHHVQNLQDTATVWAREFNEIEEIKTGEPQAWAEEFNNKEISDVSATASQLHETLDNSKFANTEFAKFIQKLGQESELDLHTDWSKEFLGLKSDTKEDWSEEFMNDFFDKGGQWANEFAEASKKGTFDHVEIDSEAMSVQEREEYWKRLQQEWDGAVQNGNSLHPWLDEFASFDNEPYKEYKFIEENSMKNHPDPLTEGKKCLEKGDLPSAVLLFEAAAQKDPNCIEAWLLLGTTHAENEQDPSAISALKRCVSLDSNNQDAWMALATSYTNESFQNLACHSLKEWIRSNPEYSHLVKNDKTNLPKTLTSSLATVELIEEVRDLYLTAANLRPAENFDCDVQCGLGVLLNLSGEYDKAVDCFQSALHAKPNDAKLWNKLGATLANSNRSTEAIDAYRHALEISPGFIRCRYNLGIACINLKVHREAVEHFLVALNMQEREQPREASLTVSDNIWSTLRVCLTHLNLMNLMPAVHKRDLQLLNKEFQLKEQI